MTGGAFIGRFLYSNADVECIQTVYSTIIFDMQDLRIWQCSHKAASVYSEYAYYMCLSARTHNPKIATRVP